MGNGFNVGNTTSYRITGLTTGRTYFFAVTAVDASGRESDLSEEKSKAIP
jgi:fibronectin type 3 domain-containing protein